MSDVLFKKMLCLKRRERKRVHSHLLTSSQMLPTAKSRTSWSKKPGNPVLVSYVGGRYPRIWAIICCFPRYLLEGRWNKNQSLDSNPNTPKWHSGVPSDFLATLPNIFLDVLFLFTFVLLSVLYLLFYTNSSLVFWVVSLWLLAIMFCNSLHFA